MVVRLHLKANSSKDTSNAIVVSFASRWQSALAAREVHLFFRKRGPRAVTPEWVYVYVGAPASALIGRFRLRQHVQLDAHRALELAGEGGLTPEELLNYLGGSSHVDAFFVDELELAPRACPLAKLKEQYKFDPPQSFLFLSIEGLAALDGALGFASSERGAT